MKIFQNGEATKKQKKRTIQETTQNLLIAHVSKLQTKSGLVNQGLYLKWVYTTFRMSGNILQFYSRSGLD